MATLQMIGASSSSSSSLVSSKKYDVFLSFRGEDTRRNFTSHLYDALIRKRVETFIDDNELQKGDDISPSLTKAIEESYVSIVIFSENYASSKWCLNELIKILECKNDTGQIVMPVFCNIDPSHVRKQTGSYKLAFAKHEKLHKKDMLQKWKTALSEAANLAGFDSTKYKDEAALIKVIVEVVLRKLKHRYPFEVKDKGLVRIEKRCEEIESLLKVGSDDVRIIGLWGMGGIGKTTLAKALCAKLCSQFDDCCFLENVREESKKHGLTIVRHKLLSALLNEENLRFDAPYVETNSIMRKLLGKKFFIVLDDVADSKQIECLMVDTNILGSGSRVIVTTRDMQIIRHLHEIYEVKELNEYDSLELFCLNSFREKHPKIGYEELLKSAIAYCKGNPLALKVLGARLGAHLGPKSKQAWESDLEKIQKIPDRKIHDVLKLSYDDLDDNQKDIFLDIACFFKGWDMDRVISLLKACGFFAVDVDVLLDKALITISTSNKIEMHDLIQEMGWEIINQEFIKEPEKRSRLWRGEEVADVLKKNKGTEAIEGIKLDCGKVGDLFLKSDCFRRMTNLRYLVIYKVYGCTIYFIDGLECLPDKLRYLQWDSFPLECLPSNFNAEMLVELRMDSSKLKKLWDGVQNVVNLKEIKLEFSKDLIEMPNLSRATNLQTLNLSHCESLRELRPYILSLPKLEVLDLTGCKKIESLKSNMHSKSLSYLSLKDCSSLAEFSVTSEEMIYLYLAGTAIREIPSSIWHHRKLKYLSLSDCYEFDIIGNKLSNDFGIMFVNMLQNCEEIQLTGYLPLSFLVMPGDQVPKIFNFQKSEGASITSPPIPKLNLRGFLFCIILSQGFQLHGSDGISYFHCTFYEHREVIIEYVFPIEHNNDATLISDHVLFLSCPPHKGENGGDHYSLSFEFEHTYVTDDIGCIERSTEGIKGCGVLPVYDML